MSESRRYPTRSPSSKSPLIPSTRNAEDNLLRKAIMATVPEHYATPRKPTGLKHTPSEIKTTPQKTILRSQSSRCISKPLDGYASDENNVFPSPKVKAKKSNVKPIKEPLSEISFNNSLAAEVGMKGLKASNKILTQVLGSKPDPLLIKAVSQQNRNQIKGDHFNRTATFARWMNLLLHDFNVCLYGLGSKLKLLRQFESTYLSNKNSVTSIRGFDSSLTHKLLLHHITLEWLGEALSNITEALPRLQEHFNADDGQVENVFIIVHSIDAPPMRSERIQLILATLAACRNVRMLASTDNINASMLWSGPTLSKFNWFWEECHPFEPMVDEFFECTESYLMKMLTVSHRGVCLASLMHVMASLHRNAKEIFMLICRHQINALEKSDHVYQGMPTETLYWQCRDAFLVNNDVTMKTQLTEFFDHKLLKEKKATDGSELLHIPLSLEELKEFVDKVEQGAV